jgi:hypothetical protein
MAQHRVDLRAGLNLSSWTHSDDAGKQDAVNEGVENNTGLQFGANYEYIITDLWSIQTGLFYEVRGTKYNYPNPGNPDEYNRSAWTPAYLIIPLHAKASFGESGSTFQRTKPVFVIYTGPYVGIAIGGDKSWDQKFGPGDPDTGELPIDWGDGGDLRNGDFGWDFGAAVEIQNFQLGVQYAAGLTNINGQSDINLIKQNVWNFYLAFTVLNDD